MPITCSVQPDYIVCLADGVKVEMDSVRARGGIR